MIKTLIITPDLVGPIHNGGIGTFAMMLARLLRQNGYAVSILFTGQMLNPPQAWRGQYEAWGIDVIHAPTTLRDKTSPGNWAFIQQSEAARLAIPEDVDIIYTQDWQGVAFQYLRDRRYQVGKRPQVVTILHSPSMWIREGMRLFPDDPESALGLDFVERYAVQQSDWVVSPSQYMRGWGRQRGWRLPPEERSRALLNPYLPPASIPREPSTPAAPAPVRQIAFVGRLETRKGIELFLVALRMMDAAVLKQVERVLLIGKYEGMVLGGDLQQMLAGIGIPIEVISDWGYDRVQAFLRDNAADTLVVMPSLVDNLPYAVVEASLIPGLRLLTTDVGGLPEILGEAGRHQLVEPRPLPLAKKLTELLTDPNPLPPAHYPWQEANAAWLAFHAERVADAEAPTSIIQPDLPSVDVCIAHYNHGQFLPQTLAALDQQTDADFGVIVVDDGSTDAASLAVFRSLADQYAGKGWRFFERAANQGLSRTRNFAAERSHADALIFVDADNLPAPQMVERMRRALAVSGDDCLTCYAFAFAGNPPEAGINGRWEVAALRKQARFAYLPLGASAELGMFVNCFGDANLIIRRDVFWERGGFAIRAPQDVAIAGEDHALLADLVLHGKRVDVIPEYLFLYRFRHDSLMRTTLPFDNMQRVQRVYRERMQAAGLGELVPLTYGLYTRALEMPSQINYADPKWLAARVPWRHMLRAMWLKLRKRLR